MAGSKPVEIALLGAGARGELNLGSILRKYPDKARFVAVAESDAARREAFARAVDIPRQNVFDDWQAMLSRPQMAEAVICALPCRLHYASTLAALAAGYHVLLEKPIAHSPAECVRLVRAARRSDRLLMVSLQCRYNDIYQRIARSLADGAIGELINIDCAENIGYWHFAMSYVRGMHSKSPTAHSFMLSKAIHDTDLINWFAGSRATSVSSFGRLSFFNPHHAPAGAPERCTDGCPAQSTCVFDAVRQYVKPGRPAIPLSLLKGMSAQVCWDYIREPRFRTLASTISHDISEKAVMKLLRETDHGRCVFRAGNDTIDHQVVNIEYDGGVTASFSLSGFSLIWERTCNLHGTKGEIRSDDFSGRFELRTYMPARVEKKRIPYHGIYHGGGDEVLLERFVEAVRNPARDTVLTRVENVLESHLLGFAAEEARRSNSVVDMAAFRRRAEEDADCLEE